MTCGATLKRGVPANWHEEFDVGAGGYNVRNSVMEAFTQHNPKPCLTEDDVEALATLYPDCSGSVSISTPVCHKVQHNIGVVLSRCRSLPLLITLFCILTFNSIVHYHKRMSSSRRGSLRQAEKR